MLYNEKILKYLNLKSSVYSILFEDHMEIIKLPKYIIVNKLRKIGVAATTPAKTRVKDFNIWDFAELCHNGKVHEM